MHGNVIDADRLLRAREELASLYNSEEVYWAQRLSVR